MNLHVDIQRNTEQASPDDESFRRWFNACLNHPALPQREASEISLCLVDSEEIQSLNRDYRHKDKPTNVLSFPAELPEELGLPLLGDIIICNRVIEQEATEQNKSLESHWAHMCIHGTLHLLGYDHINDSEAEIMEKLETDIMVGLGYLPPYE